MNIPNLLTLLRIFFVPFLVAVLVQTDIALPAPDGRSANVPLALGIFLAAAMTDLLDGYLARKWKQITTIGTLLDPIADKLLISAALISLVQVRAVAGWMVILIVGREFAVSGLRAIAAAEGYTIHASDLGKTKMISQVAAVSFLMLGMRYQWLARPAQWLMWVVVFFSVISAALYFQKFWRKVDDRIKLRRRREFLALERRRKAVELRRARPNVARAEPPPAK